MSDTENWDWDEEEDDDDDLDDLEDDDFYYYVYMPNTKPLNMERVRNWTSHRSLEIDVAPDEAYVYWNIEMDGESQAHWNSRIGAMAFQHPEELAWEYVDESIRHKVHTGASDE